MAIVNNTQLNTYRRFYQRLEIIVKKTNENTYTAAIFSFLVISLFGWYAIRPTLQTILFLRREIIDNEKVNERMEEKIAKLIQAQTSFQSIQDSLPLLRLALPDRPDAINVVVQLRNLANLSQSSVSSIMVSSVPIVADQETDNQNASIQSSVPTPAPSPPVSKGTNKNRDEMPISVTINGSYPTLRTYVEGLLSMKRIITIDSLSFAKAEDRHSSSESAQIPLKLILNLTAYYKKI